MATGTQPRKGEWFSARGTRVLHYVTNDPNPYPRMACGYLADDRPRADGIGKRQTKCLACSERTRK